MAGWHITKSTDVLVRPSWGMLPDLGSTSSEPTIAGLISTDAKPRSAELGLSSTRSSPSSTSVAYILRIRANLVPGP